MPVDDAAAAADVAAAADAADDDDDDDVCFISLRQRCDAAVADLTLSIGFSLLVALVVVVNTLPHFRVSALFFSVYFSFIFMPFFAIGEALKYLDILKIFKQKSLLYS